MVAFLSAVGNRVCKHFNKIVCLPPSQESSQHHHCECCWLLCVDEHLSHWRRHSSFSVCLHCAFLFQDIPPQVYLDLPGRSDKWPGFWIRGTQMKSSAWLAKWCETHNPDPENPQLTSTFIRKLWNTIGQDEERVKAISVLASGSGHHDVMAKGPYQLRKDLNSAMNGKMTIQAAFHDFGGECVPFPNEITPGKLEERCKELAPFFKRRRSGCVINEAEYEEETKEPEGGNVDARRKEREAARAPEIAQANIASTTNAKRTRMTKPAQPESVVSKVCLFALN